MSPISQRLLQVSCLAGIGAVAVRKLASQILSSPRSADEVISDFFEARRLDTSSLDMAATKAVAILERCQRKGISVRSLLDDSYPERLRPIDDAPPFLYVRGNEDALRLTSVAVVGTRKASDPGVRIAERIGYFLAKQGYAVVSGLALGIDAAAHRGAVAAEGVTVAVLAHGLDKVSPSANEPLAMKILDWGGALVSEHPPGFPALRQEFVRRNRIQSGLSFCSIVVETGEKGGTVHQARFTTEQGRDLLVILPDPSSATTSFDYSGGQMMVNRMGGRSIRNQQDLSDYFQSKSTALPPPHASGSQMTLPWQ